MDCFHNTDVLQQSENDLFALRIKKHRCLLFSVNLYSCVPTEECAKKGLDTKEYSVLLLFSFFNIKHKIGTLLLLSGLFSLVTQVFSIDFTLYL